LFLLQVQLEQVNPIIDWNYGHVWKFLKYFELPYCCLYDQGYTSIGTPDNTRPNPALLRSDGKYDGADRLVNWEMERAGREGKVESDDKKLSNQEVLQTLKQVKTIGILIVGDEILKGKVEDENSFFAIKALRSQGLSVERVSIVRDDAREIADEIRRLSSSLDLVISSGGVGPTHDDVTLKAVASAFSSPQEFNQDMLSRLPRVLQLPPGSALSEANRKLAWLPRCSFLLDPPTDGEKPLWPLLLCSNVFVLPGVPKFFQSKMKAILRFLPSRRLVIQRLTVYEKEQNLVPEIDALVEKFPSVNFGSYPLHAEGEELTVVTLEAAVEEEEEDGGGEVEKARKMAEEMFRSRRLRVTVDQEDEVSSAVQESS